MFIRCDTTYPSNLSTYTIIVPYDLITRSTLEMFVKYSLCLCLDLLIFYVDCREIYIVNLSYDATSHKHANASGLSFLGAYSGKLCDINILGRGS